MNIANNASISAAFIDWLSDWLFGTAGSTNKQKVSNAPTRFGRIAPGRTFTFTAPRNGTLKVACGLVWLTVSGDKKDYWLSGGQSLELITGQITVLQAETTQGARWIFVAEN